MAMNMLPEDILTEILLGLPVKTLLRFRCVSKTWHDLISSNYFVGTHLRHAKNRINNRVILVKNFDCKNGKKTVLSFHFLDADDNSLRVVAPDLELPSWDRYCFGMFGSCNGIVCFSDSYEVYLVNPATRQFLKLPTSPSFGCLDGFESNRVFSTSIRFWFDPNTEDYKVVKLFNLSNTRSSRLWFGVGALVYKLSTNSWTKLDHVLPLCLINSSKTSFPALLNGFFHWDARKPEPYESYPIILSFNMCAETFQELGYPSGLHQPDVWADVFVLEECLAAFSIKHYDGQLNYLSSIDIWVMVEYGVQESWIKKCSLGSLTGGLKYPLLCWNNDKLILRQGSWEGHLICCSLQDNCQDTRKYDIFGNQVSLSVIEYQETLVSLKLPK